MIDLRSCIRDFGVFIFLGAVLSSPSYSVTKDELAVAQSRYKQEIDDCNSNPAVQDVPACLRDAKNSLAEIKRGRMTEAAQAAELERNALLRCDVHQGDDKTACIARIRGQGRTQGSVMGGGLLRELETTVPVRSTP